MGKPADRIHEIIPAASYPQAIRLSDIAEFLNTLKSEAVHKHLGRIVAAKRYELCEVVRASVARLEEAARNSDLETAYAEAHDIRGLAALAGFTASGRIADGLCLYLDALNRAGKPADTGIVGLHVGSIVRAAYAEDEATRLGSEVDDELRALVRRRLATCAAKVSASSRPASP